MNVDTLENMAQMETLNLTFTKTGTITCREKIISSSEEIAATSRIFPTKKSTVDPRLGLMFSDEKREVILMERTVSTS